MEDRYYFPRVNDFYIVRLEILKNCFEGKGLFLSSLHVGILNITTV